MNDKSVIFDLGNVLVFVNEFMLSRRILQVYDLNESFLYQKRDSLEAVAKEFDEGKISPEKFTERFARVLNVDIDVSQFKEMWSDMLTENVPAMNIVKELKGKARLLILSNINLWHFEYIRMNFDVLNHFDDLILSFELGYGKPDRRIFERAIECSRGSKQILYFDNIPEFVDEASKLGIHAYQYTGEDFLYRALINEGVLE